MRLPGITILAALSVVASGRVPPAAGADLPGVIFAKANGSPFWVSADTATSASRDIRWDILGEEARLTYEGVRNSKPMLKLTAPGQPPEYDLDYSGALPDCIHYGATFENHFNAPSDRTLQEVARNARAQLRGEIIGIESGFYRGEPSSLLEVKITRRLRAKNKFAANDLFYIAYPYARFSIGSINFCKQDSNFPFRPAVGDQILFFPFYEALDAEGRLITLGPQQMIFEQKTDGLVLPKRFQGNEGEYKSLANLEKTLLKNSD